MAWRSPEEIRDGLLRIWQAMQDCVQRGLEQTGYLPGGLKVARIVLVGRVVNSEFHRIAEPEGVFSVQINGEATSESVIPGLLSIRSCSRDKRIRIVGTNRCRFDRRRDLLDRRGRIGRRGRR